MYARLRAARQKDDGGFTLIELLIVIVILGILAAVVVFSVNGIQDRGQKSACKSDVATVQVAEEAYYATNSSYATVAQLVTANLIRTNAQMDVAIDTTSGLVTPGTTKNCAKGV